MSLHLIITGICRQQAAWPNATFDMTGKLQEQLQNQTESGNQGNAVRGFQGLDMK